MVRSDFVGDLTGGAPSGSFDALTGVFGNVFTGVFDDFDGTFATAFFGAFNGVLADGFREATADTLTLTGVDSISTPKMSLRSPASSPPPAGPTPALAAVFAAALMSSCMSVPRRVKKSSGFPSSRAPTPYSAAATCLHMEASSGQEQANSISLGEGKSPPGLRVISWSTPLSSRPWSKSRRLVIFPAQRFLKSLHAVVPSWVTVTSTW